MSRVEEPLPAGVVQAILRGDSGTARDTTDPLVIKRVDYYFHESVMEVDFSRPNAYLPRDAWADQVEALEETRLGQRSLWEDIRYRAWVDDDESVPNTHPFGYIGSDNKGLNQALEAPGGSNQDAHGTYPFAGRYANVGPGGTTDQVTRWLDHRDYLAALAAGEDDLGPDFEAGSVLGLAMPERIRLLPDWERVVELAWSGPDHRRAWSWMLLPLHWGYPATQSPFSGILENFNTGNVAPPGPSYNAGWNVSGASSGFAAYDPHSVPSLFPLQVQDAYRNDLGFLNLTVPTLLNLPPLDFVSRLVAYPFRLLLGRPEPVYYPNRSVPTRFVGLSSGLSRVSFAEEFQALTLNSQQFDEFATRLILYIAGQAGPDTEVVGVQDELKPALGTFVQVPFYLGERFVTENTLRSSRARIGASFQFSDIPDYVYSADLEYWEYAGSLRYNVIPSPVEAYVKGGYGWAWYRLDDVQSNGVPFTPARTAWNGPGILPNVWHYGLGVEWVPLRQLGGDPGGFDLGIRAEFVRYTQNLKVDLSGVSLQDLGILFRTLDDVPAAQRAAHNDLVLALTLSF